MSAILVSPAGTQEKDLKNCFWWSLFLGPFYFGYMGVWDTAVISFLLAVISGGLSVLIYPFFTEKIIVANYRKKGWKIKDRAAGAFESGAAGKLRCESCGMPMDVDEVSRFDLRYCIHCQDQKTGDLKAYQQVRDGSIEAAVKFLGKSREEAVKMTEELMPKLARWKRN
jgi:hypothetical protein